MQRAMHTSALLGDALQHLAAASESRPPLFRGATERAGVWLGPGELPDAKPIVLRCCLPNIAALLHPCRTNLLGLTRQLRKVLLRYSLYPFCDRRLRRRLGRHPLITVTILRQISIGP